MSSSSQYRSLLKSALFITLITGASLTQNTPASAQMQADQNTAPIMVGAIQIKTPWARATPNGAGVAGGFMLITNTGKEPDTLTGGSASFSDRVEIHEMAVTDGVMRMRPLSPGLVIQPGQSIELRPGSYHVMFMGLKRQLKEGETVTGTLTFEKAGTTPISYSVRSLAARGSDAMQHKH